MKKLIIYLTAGYPSLEDSFYIMEGISDLVDGIEIGIPFTDPLADGPVIQMASSYALEKQLKVEDVFSGAFHLAKRINIPLYFMTYCNLLYHQGVDNFMRKASACGISGVIVPDVPLEEAKPFLVTAKRYGIEVVMFITPVTEDKRARQIAQVSTGFLYYVSVTGVTGERKQVNQHAIAHIKKLKKMGITKPIFLGFGISSPEHVRQAVEVADGVIVGSALIKEINPEANRQENLKKIRRKVEWLKEGLL